LKSNPTLVKACLTWDKLTDKLKTLDTPEGSPFYSPVDFEPLKCRIDGNHAEVTVGSSPGHRTHIDLDEGTVTYYDRDPSVNEVMYDILSKEVGLTCSINVYEGVGCEGLTEDKVKDVFKAISMPTSMDIRLERCEAISYKDAPPNVARQKCKQRELQFYKTHIKNVV